MKLTLRSLMKEVGNHTELTQKLSSKVVTRIFRLITQGLKRGESVRILGLGTFYVKKVKPRRHRYSFTNLDTLYTPSRYRVRFRPHPELLRSLNARPD